jgi:hypothetical protein
MLLCIRIPDYLTALQPLLLPRFCGSRTIATHLAFAQAVFEINRLFQKKQLPKTKGFKHFCLKPFEEVETIT